MFLPNWALWSKTDVNQLRSDIYSVFRRGPTFNYCAIWYVSKNSAVCFTKGSVCPWSSYCCYTSRCVQIISSPWAERFWAIFSAIWNDVTWSKMPVVVFNNMTANAITLYQAKQECAFFISNIWLSINWNTYIRLIPTNLPDVQWLLFASCNKYRMES